MRDPRERLSGCPITITYNDISTGLRWYQIVISCDPSPIITLYYQLTTLTVSNINVLLC